MKYDMNYPKELPHRTSTKLSILYPLAELMYCSFTKFEFLCHPFYPDVIYGSLKSVKRRITCGNADNGRTGGQH